MHGMAPQMPGEWEGDAKIPPIPLIQRERFPPGFLDSVAKSESEGPSLRTTKGSSLSGDGGKTSLK